MTEDQIKALGDACVKAALCFPHDKAHPLGVLGRVAVLADMDDKDIQRVHQYLYSIRGTTPYLIVSPF